MNQKTIYNNQSINQSTTFTFYPPGVWFAGVIVLRLFCFVFFLTLSLKQRPFTFVQSFFNVRAPRQPKSVSSFSPFVYFGDVAFFRVFFVPLPFSLCMESTLYVFSFQMVYFLVQPCFLRGPIRGYNLLCAYVFYNMPVSRFGYRQTEMKHNKFKTNKLTNNSQPEPKF